MARLFYVLGILSLICAGLLLRLSGARLLRDAPQNENDLPISVNRQALIRQNPGQNDSRLSSPLLEQAAAFALYLDPPKPTPHKDTPLPTVGAPPVARPASPTPQFRLLGISYDQSHPDRSLAMVSDASQGGRWIRKGEHLGYFVVERIEKEAIIYRDGDQLRQLVVTIKEPVQLARLRSRELASIQSVTAGETLAGVSR